MLLLIDTDVAIHMRDSEPSISERVERLEGKPVISVVTRVELESGVVKEPQYGLERRERLDFLLSVLSTLPFDQAETDAYRKIVEEIGYSRRQLLDRMIAAQAIVASAELVTLNPQDFYRIPGLRLADW